MSLENKTNLMIAVRGYTSIKRERAANLTDITALDNSNNKVLLRIIEPFGEEYIGFDEIRNVIQEIEQESFDQAILISKRFTARALQEMDRQKIQHVSDDYMPAFDIEALYMAIVNHTSNQCQKKCGKLEHPTPDCTEEKAADLCKIRTLIDNAKLHLAQGSIGLLKNDLKVALALNQKAAF